MANIIIDADTTKETIKVSVDGKNIPDVQSVSVSKYIPWDEKDAEPEVTVNIISGTSDDDAKVSRTLITTCAKEIVETKDQITEELIKILFNR